MGVFFATGSSLEESSESDDDEDELDWRFLLFGAAVGVCAGLLFAAGVGAFLTGLTTILGLGGPSSSDDESESLDDAAFFGAFLLLLGVTCLAGDVLAAGAGFTAGLATGVALLDLTAIPSSSEESEEEEELDCSLGTGLAIAFLTPILIAIFRSDMLSTRKLDERCVTTCVEIAYVRASNHNEREILMFTHVVRGARTLPQFVRVQWRTDKGTMLARARATLRNTHRIAAPVAAAAAAIATFTQARFLCSLMSWKFRSRTLKCVALNADSAGALFSLAVGKVAG